MSRVPEDVPADFWELIALARSDREQYRSRVKEMSREQLIDFYWAYENLAAEIKSEKHVRHMDPGFSEDSIDNLAFWVVAQGEEFYTDVLNNPERTPERAGTGAGYLDDVVREYARRYQTSVPFPDKGA